MKWLCMTLILMHCSSARAGGAKLTKEVPVQQFHPVFEKMKRYYENEPKTYAGLIKEKPEGRREFDFSNMDFDDDGMGLLIEFPNLESLDISQNPRITANGLQVIPRLSKLRSLTIQEIEFGDDGMEMIAQSQSITTLWMDSEKLTLSAISSLKKMPRLYQLGFDHSDGPRKYGTGVTKKDIDGLWEKLNQNEKRLYPEPKKKATGN